MASTASLHKNRKTTLGRILRSISKDANFNSSANQIISKGPNLYSRLYSAVVPLEDIKHWALKGSWKNYNFDEVRQQRFTDTQVGNTFGPTWATHWFKVTIVVPEEWKGKEVHFRWVSGSEATLWDENGNVLQGLSPGFREEFVISNNWEPGRNDRIVYYMEMACNGMFGAAEGKSLCIDAPDPDLKFKLARADVAVFEKSFFKLYTDLEILHGLANQLPEDHRGYQAMFCANEMINLIGRNEIVKASQIADKFFAEKNGDKAHTLVAMGHCHIDTAWLWTYDETIRKCARSWSSQIRLMEEYPDFIFTCSQAQQFVWMKEHYPSLYEKIKYYVRKGNFVPVGGTWIEMDGNIPSGESFIRQFYYGQKYFEKEFGVLCKEFWLPDTFGYSAQTPQIIKHVGIDRFLTQKLSWSLVNKFPHHNFWWEGIDGTSVLVHFPPGDSYEMNGIVPEMLKTVNNSQDKGRANVSAYLFGFGDGGGGPTKAMLERMKRARDVDGLPKVVLGTPDHFFEELLKEKGKLSKWVGELYLELHNGTYTSQGKIKWFNRKCEFFIREVELLMAIASCYSKVNKKELSSDIKLVDENWKKILLNQFHDVLPGSCIELVTKDAWQLYTEVFNDLNILRHLYHIRILGNKISHKVIYNPLPWSFFTVILNNPNDNEESTEEVNANVQLVSLSKTEFSDQLEGNYRVPNKFAASLVILNPSGYSAYEPLIPIHPVVYQTNDFICQFTNGIIRLEVSLKGVPNEKIFFVEKTGEERAVYSDKHNTGTSPGMFYLYEDVPLFWDAWDCMDYHLETRQNLPYTSESSKGHFEFISEGPVIGVYKWECKFGNNSSIVRYTILRAESPMVEYYAIVDWKENHKFLKVEFPVDILARDATFEIQYGHVKRPTHTNTSWDMAQFEVCGHKWMDISQADRGVSFITDSKYGWHVRDNIVSLSLLRSPKSPDANCDIHKHYIHYAVLPHEGSFQEADVIRRAYELNFLGANNVPMLKTGLDPSELIESFITSSSPAVVIEAVKVAAEIPRAICVRMYESFGGSASAIIKLGFVSLRIDECNGLEQTILTLHDKPCDKFIVNLNPFQIKSFLIYSHI